MTNGNQMLEKGTGDQILGVLMSWFQSDVLDGRGWLTLLRRAANLDMHALV